MLRITMYDQSTMNCEQVIFYGDLLLVDGERCVPIVEVDFIEEEKND